MTPRLLLVEDDQVYAELLSRALTRAGYECVTVNEAAAALAVIAGRPADAVILDLKLADETSLSLIAPLRQQLPQARIILLTGYASIATAVEAIKLGADDYLPKPANTATILAALAGEVTAKAVKQLEQPLSPRRLEWEHIQRVLAEHDGNVSAAARALGLHRRTLQRKLAKKPLGR